MRTVFQVEYRVTNKDQTIDYDDSKDFGNLEVAKVFLLAGFAEWDGSGKGIANGQISEEERDYNGIADYIYDVIRRRVYSPVSNGKWDVDEWYED